jgi:hypothetical protein
MLKHRIKARLDALGMNAFEAARIAGWERAYINDLLAGRKAGVHAKNYAKLAEVLSCTVEYLRGEVDQPAQGAAPEHRFPSELAALRLPLKGAIELGSFRKSREEAEAEWAPIGADPRFEGTRQMAFEVRISTVRNQVFRRGRSFLGAVDYDDYTSGWGAVRNDDLVVVETQSDSAPELVETTCCEVTFADREMYLITRFSNGKRNRTKLGNIHKIIAVVSRYVQMS